MRGLRRNYEQNPAGEAVVLKLATGNRQLETIDKKNGDKKFDKLIFKKDNNHL
jgi:hypothetical protein